MTPQEGMRAVLTEREHRDLAARLETAPASVVIGAWIRRVSAVLVVLRYEGVVQGWIVSSAANESEAYATARDIAAQLEANFEATRDAREAARLLLERIGANR